MHQAVRWEWNRPALGEVLSCTRAWPALEKHYHQHAPGQHWETHSVLHWALGAALELHWEMHQATAGGAALGDALGPLLDELGTTVGNELGLLLEKRQDHTGRCTRRCAGRELGPALNTTGSCTRKALASTGRALGAPLRRTRTTLGDTLSVLHWANTRTALGTALGDASHRWAGAR
jgi:hypothetical protein